MGAQTACVSVAPPLPASDTSEHLGVITIAPAQYVPDSNFNTFAKGAGAGAAKGAATWGGLTAGSMALEAASAGAMAPVVVFAGILTTAAMSALGAVEGAQLAVPATTAQQVDALIDKAVADLDAQNRLAADLATAIGAEPWIRLASVDTPGPTGPTGVDAQPTYTQLHNTGIDSVLEVAITEIGFESCGPEFVRRLSSACPDDVRQRSVDLFLSARARLVRATDGKELFARSFRYKSALRAIPRWVANDGRLLAEEFDHAYRELAERIRDELLLTSPIELPAPASFVRLQGPGHPGYGLCWLAPVEPKAAPMLISEMLAGAAKIPARLPPDVCPASGMHFSKVPSLRPTLRWETFPRALDRAKLASDVLRRVHDVTYELKIWQAEGCERGWPVYERIGLVNPEHTLQQPLAPATRYFWSVRARFTLGGRPAVTPWSFFDATTCFPNDIADWEYHRFVTPP